MILTMHITCTTMHCICTSKHTRTHTLIQFATFNELFAIFRSYDQKTQTIQNELQRFCVVRALNVSVFRLTVFSHHSFCSKCNAAFYYCLLANPFFRFVGHCFTFSTDLLLLCVWIFFSRCIVIACICDQFLRCTSSFFFSRSFGVFSPLCKRPRAYVNQLIYLQ